MSQSMCPSTVVALSLVALSNAALAQVTPIESSRADALAVPTRSTQERLVDWGGGPLADPTTRHECVPADVRSRVTQSIRAWRALNGGGSGAAPAPPQPYTFFPMGGQLYRDVFTQNFVDLDPSPALLDWDCSDRTYDGHQGNDTLLRSFGEQLIGVPIFAALDGVVVATDDGHPDMNTTWAGQPPNFVAIDHGGGKFTFYYHMRNGSVAVSVGQNVVAGQQIGLVASSGNSNWPHLHFEEQLPLGNVIEPYTGTCNPGPSGWVQQVPIDYSLYLSDFATSYIPPASVQVPNPLPRSGQWPQTNTTLYFWGFWKGLPANSQWRVRIKRPDGVLAFDSSPQSFNNPNYYRSSWWRWGYNIPSMRVHTGTWNVRVTINNIVQIDAPLEVVPVLVPGFNRPPEPISVAFAPACPVPADVVACEVQTDLALDDLDWDILSYHYVWRVNGVVVRDVTSAAHSDYLPRNSWTPGDVLTCDVTPGDGTVDGATASARFPSLVSYCTAGTTSDNCNATMGSAGTPSLNNSGPFTLTCTSVPGNKNGIFFYSIAGQNSAPWGNSTSFLCIKAPTQRMPPSGSGGNNGQCDGSYANDWNAYVAANPNKAINMALMSGTAVGAQAWFRDPSAGTGPVGAKGTALSDALEFVVCP